MSRYGAQRSEVGVGKEWKKIVDHHWKGQLERVASHDEGTASLRATVKECTAEEAVPSNSLEMVYMLRVSVFRDPYLAVDIWRWMAMVNGGEAVRGSPVGQ